MKNKTPFSSFKIIEFRWFLLMRLFIVLAWSVQFVLIEWEVYKITKDPWSLGLIGLMEIIPAISLALYAGHVIDYSKKRKSLLICFSSLVVFASGMCWLLHPQTQLDFKKDFILNGMYFLVFMGGVVRAFLIPSVFSLLGLIVPNKEKPNAAAWSSSTWQVSAVIGPAIVGFTIKSLGVYNSMLGVVICMLVAIIALLQIKEKPVLNEKKGEPITKSLKEGLHFVWNNKTILNAISLDMFAVLFGGAVALLPVFATDILKVGSEGFGVLRAAPAIGGLITMLLATYIPLNHQAGKKLLVSVFFFGICIIVFGVSTHFWISVVALFMSGVFDGVSVVIRQTILQLFTPDNMRGRVSSVNSIFVGSSNELGAFESGLTSRFMGAVNAVFFGGIMTLVVVITMAVKAPKFRNLDINKELKN